MHHVIESIHIMIEGPKYPFLRCTERLKSIRMDQAMQQGFRVSEGAPHLASDFEKVEDGEPLDIYLVISKHEVSSALMKNDGKH